jgi:hypothetical protein
MRLTVGPLPPAVYWRRRAVVLGALMLVIIALYTSCSGSGSADDKKKTSAGQSPSPSVSDIEPEPTETLLTPETGAPAETGDPGTGDPGTGPTGAGGPPQAPAGNSSCADEEMTITPVPAKTTISRKTPVDIRLKIENSGDRSCSRDVGADVQELRIVKGAETVWSSDHCGAQRGSDVRTLEPGATREYMVTWNGKSSAKCSAGVPAGVVPAAGQYQLLARLGTKHSTPIVLTLT